MSPMSQDNSPIPITSQELGYGDLNYRQITIDIEANPDNSGFTKDVIFEILKLLSVAQPANFLENPDFILPEYSIRIKDREQYKLINAAISRRFISTFILENMNDGVDQTIFNTSLNQAITILLDAHILYPVYTKNDGLTELDPELYTFTQDTQDNIELMIKGD